MKPLFLRMVAEAIDDINLIEARLADRTERIPEKEAEGWVAILRGARRTFEGMGLPSTVDQIDRFEREILGLDVKAPYVLELIRELKHRYEDELKRSLCFMMTAERVRYWETKQLFGSEVWERFPSANSDVEEAGKCLACNRGTATVFHLMRVMEVGLKATAAALEIPYAPSWESYLVQIQGQLDRKWKAKPPKWKAHEAFFREVHGYLRAVKLAWRNPTMHIANSYSPEIAEEVFTAVRAFMRHLATKLGEK